MYAGDAHRDDTARHGVHEYVFTLDVEAEPHALLRVTMVFNLANRAPRSLSFVSQADGTATIVIRISLQSAVQADWIRRKIEQLTCTLSVALAEIT